MNPVRKLLARLWAWMRTGTATRLPASLASGMRRVDAVIGRRRQNADIALDDLEGCVSVHARLYAVLVTHNGTESNTEFRVEDRANLFVLSTKLAALQDPRHDAWPMLSELRAAAYPALQRRVVGHSDDWTTLAALCAALSVGDIPCALDCFAKVRGDALIVSLVKEWTWEMTIGYAYANPAGHAAAFLDAAALPPEPQTSRHQVLTPAQRWVLSLVIYPSYARDQRVTLAPSWSTGACRVMLAESWRARTTDEARKMLSWLMNAGAAKGLAHDLARLDGPLFASDARLDVIEERRGEFERHGLLAWDLCRLMQVARTAFGAQYISEDEAWWWMFEAARLLRVEFASWDDVADDYLLGTRHNSKRGAEDPYHAGAITWMRTSTESPWSTLPWEIDLALLGGASEQK